MEGTGEFGKTRSIEDKALLPFTTLEKESSLAKFSFCSLGKKLEKQELNEDLVGIFPEVDLATLLDGAGGHKGAQDAAKIGAEIIVRGFSRKDDFEGPDEKIAFLAHEIYEEANEAVVTLGEETNQEGMGTTATTIKLLPGSSEEDMKALIVHAGDSRAYILRADGFFDQLTLDDDFIRYEISRDDPDHASVLQKCLGNTLDARDFSPEELALFKDSRRLGIHNGLGGKKGEIDVQVSIHIVRPGEKIVLVSDGITDNLTDEEIKKWVIVGSVSGLVAEAHEKSVSSKTPERSGKPPKKDDISVAFIEIKGKKGELTWQAEGKKEKNTPFKATSLKELCQILLDEKFTQPGKTLQETGDIVARIIKLELKAEDVLKEYDRGGKNNRSGLDLLTRKRNLRPLVIELLRKKVAAE